MSPHARFRHFAWTLAVAASLLLKAAVPFLAAGAAAARGLPVAEICSVYGVRTAAAALQFHPQDGAGHAHQLDAALPGAPAHDGPHDAPGALPRHGEHCALGALSAFAPPPPAAQPALAPTAVAVQAEAGRGEEPARDATARWSALRKQGPPRAG